MQVPVPQQRLSFESIQTVFLAEFKAQARGSVTPTWPWYLPPLSL